MEEYRSRALFFIKEFDFLINWSNNVFLLKFDIGVSMLFLDSTILDLV